MSPSQWVFAPNSGGVKISKTLKLRTETLIRSYAEENFFGRYTRLDIRFRVNFATSTLTQSQHHWGQIGLHPIGLRAAKNTWNVYGIRQYTSAGCVTLGAMIVGDLLFTVTARDDMSCQSTPPGSFF